MKKTLESPSSQSSGTMLQRWLNQYRQNPLAAIQESNEAFDAAVEAALPLLKKRGYKTEVDYYSWLRDTATTRPALQLNEQVLLKGHSLLILAQYIAAKRDEAILFRTVRQNLKTKVEEPVIARSRRRRSNLASAEKTGPRLLRCARNDPLPLRPVLEFCPIVLSNLPRLFTEKAEFVLGERWIQKLFARWIQQMEPEKILKAITGPGAPGRRSYKTIVGDMRRNEKIFHEIEKLKAKGYYHNEAIRQVHGKLGDLGIKERLSKPALQKIHREWTAGIPAHLQHFDSL